MPLGVPLSTLRRNLRAETGTSLNPLQGIAAQATLDLILDRQQRELWDAYTWRHLRIYRDVPLAVGQGEYNYPADLPYDQIITVWFAAGTSGRWRPLTYGISLGMIPPSGPPRGTPAFWDNAAAVGGGVTEPVGQLMIHPLPGDASMLLRLEGQAAINPLVADTDKCVLDSQLITLFAAAEVLANQKSEGAAMKLTKAQNHLRQLLKNQAATKRVNYNMGGSQRFGNDPYKPRAVPYLDFIPS
jgi:hypothetical protein